MKKILLITAALFLGCQSPTEKQWDAYNEMYIPIKPFYVIDKYIVGGGTHATYTISDKNHHQIVISDLINKYSVGDTIK